MTDILLLVFCGAAGFLFGCVLEKNVAKRERFFFDLKNFCTQMQNNINFHKLSIADFFKKFQCSASDDFNKAFNEFLANGSVKIPLGLTKIHKSYVERFFNGLNGLNSDACKQHLNYFHDYFSEQLAVIQQENSKRQQLYKKLGLLTGAMVGIMLI